MSLRAATVFLSAVTLASFLVASYSVKVTLNERDKRAQETEVAAERNCLRLRAIVDYIDVLAPSVSLRDRLADIDESYRDSDQCIEHRGGR